MKTEEKPAKKTTATQKTARRPRRPKVLNIIKNDPWLEPYADAITGRHQDAVNREKELLKGDAKTLN
ncbi:MAG: hypothetical protein K2K84_03405, partial [Muribaculaceae bacterium]|nr:hypothetical protein [Muribaculaceae bacterium]